MQIKELEEEEEEEEKNGEQEEGEEEEKEGQAKEQEEEKEEQEEEQEEEKEEQEEEQEEDQEEHEEQEVLHAEVSEKGKALASETHWIHLRRMLVGPLGVVWEVLSELVRNQQLYIKVMKEWYIQGDMLHNGWMGSNQKYLLLKKQKDITATQLQTDILGYSVRCFHHLMKINICGLWFCWIS